jgi:hypothetical protein
MKPSYLAREDFRAARLVIDAGILTRPPVQLLASENTP